MYCSRKGDALRLSTGMLKKPWISFWWRSMVIRWVRPGKKGITFNILVTFLMSRVCGGKQDMLET